jgi:CRP/FNR family transcriptional regulator, cyclic AMP receptor protein
MRDLKESISAHPFLIGLAPQYVDVIVGCASNVQFENATFLFKEGQEADKFYFIHSGKVSLDIFSPIKGALVIDTLEDGDVLGWSWLVPPYRWKFDARAIGLVRAIAFDGKCLRNKCDANHDLGYELLQRVTRIMEQRLQSARLQLLDLYGTPVSK